jgi:hypothetical protein
LVCTVDLTWVAVFNAVTVAPATKAPEISVTVPFSCDEVESCARAEAASSNAIRIFLNVMVSASPTKIGYARILTSNAAAATLRYGNFAVCYRAGKPLSGLQCH